MSVKIVSITRIPKEENEKKIHTPFTSKEYSNDNKIYKLQ